MARPRKAEPAVQPTSADYPPALVAELEGIERRYLRRDAQDLVALFRGGAIHRHLHTDGTLVEGCFPCERIADLAHRAATIDDEENDR